MEYVKFHFASIMTQYPYIQGISKSSFTTKQIIHLNKLYVPIYVLFIYVITHVDMLTHQVTYFQGDKLNSCHFNLTKEFDTCLAPVLNILN